jgi:benzoyl-CoA reductase/2-hydroxyglutaryl-CoA dehydratase subunit BcrC/BadD/HgdB
MDDASTIDEDQVTQESLRYRIDVPLTDDPIVGMAEQIGEIEGCPVLYDLGKKRGTMLIDLVKKSSADGVVFVQTKFCDPEEYDYVPIKKMLDKAGFPSLLVEIDQQTANYEQARIKIETFCDITR